MSEIEFLKEELEVVEWLHDAVWKTRYIRDVWLTDEELLILTTDRNYLYINKSTSFTGQTIRMRRTS
jgi:hypothetical protein